MATLNPMITVPGTVPILGYSLGVHWIYVAALGASIVSAHAILVGLILLISRPIIVGGDSNIAVARLLHGLVGRLHNEGSLLNPKELAEMLERGNPGRKEKISYGVRDTMAEGKAGAFAVELSGNVKIRKNLPGGRFPTGEYL